MLQSKFILPPILKYYCLQSIGHKENNHRHHLTKKCCDPYESNEERLKNILLIRINETIWREFVLLRSTTKFHAN